MPLSKPRRPPSTRPLTGRMDASAVDSLSLDEEGAVLSWRLRSILGWLSAMHLPRAALHVAG
jgi:hypothetical protein